MEYLDSINVLHLFVDLKYTKHLEKVTKIPVFSLINQYQRVKKNAKMGTFIT